MEHRAVVEGVTATTTLAVSAAAKQGKRKSRIIRIRSKRPFNGRLSVGEQVTAAASDVGASENLTEFGTRKAPTQPDSLAQMPTTTAASSTISISTLQPQLQPQNVPASDFNDNATFASSQTLHIKAPVRHKTTATNQNQRNNNNQNSRQTSFAGKARAFGEGGDDGGVGADEAEEAVADLQAANFDFQIATSKTRAQLSCDSGEMILRLNFSEPFRGIVYPDQDRLSPCRLFGDGQLNYELRLPLRGCGTRQPTPRVFVNDVFVRFHKSLELEEDEMKTLICRYPAPLAAQLPTSSSTSTASSLSAIEPFEQHHQHRQQSSNANKSRPPSNSELEHETDFKHFAQHPSIQTTPTTTLTTNSTAIDALSETILVSPSAGDTYSSNVLQQQLADYQTNQHHQLNQNQNHSLNHFRLTSPYDRQHQKFADLIDTRNSLLRPSQHQAPTSSVGRLSAIELLLLGSTLALLVLLALGLLAGYVCVRRRRRGRRPPSAASILRRRPRMAPVAIPHQHHLHMQQHQQRPSSPDSDLSGAHNLLLATAHHQHPVTASYLAAHHQHHWQQQQQQHQHHQQQHFAARPLAAHFRLQYPPTANGRVGGRFEGQQPPASAATLGRRQLRNYRFNDPRAVQVIQQQQRNHHEPRLVRAKSLLTIDEMSNTNCATNNQRNQNYKSHADNINRLLVERRRRASKRLADEAAARRAHISSTTDRSSSTSSSHSTQDSDQEPSNKINHNIATIMAHKPKIVLKNIEDSYITNYTEIYEQEYRLRDDRELVDLGENLAKSRYSPKQVASSPSVNTNKPKCFAADDHDNGSSYTAASSPSSSSEIVNGGNSNHRENGVRSLTELEVGDFTTHSLTPNVNQHNVNIASSNSDNNNISLSISRHPVKQSAPSGLAKAELAKVTSATDTDTNVAVSASPDLILSPDYDFNKLDYHEPDGTRQTRADQILHV